MSDLKESFNTNDDDYGNFGGASWLGQTFTTTSAYTITSVKLKMFKSGSPGTLTIRIRATSGTYPVTPDLCIGTIDPTTFTTNTAGDWYEITFGAGAPLTDATVYGITANYDSTSGTVGWRRNFNSGLYAGGKAVVSDTSGGDGTWADSVAGNTDDMFETWGTVGGGAVAKKVPKLLVLGVD